MDDKRYTIWFAEDASDWNKFIVKVIQKPHCTVRQQPLSQLHHPLTLPQRILLEKARLHIVILSPQFLQFLSDNPTVFIGKLLDGCPVVAILCGVSEANLDSNHRANLITFDSWTKIAVVDNDPNIFNNLNTVLAEVEQTVRGSDAIGPQAAFKLNPCKARESCSKVTIELQKPISEEDHISASVQTIYENIPLILKYYNPYTVKFILPDRFFGTSQIVHIHVNLGTEFLGCRPLKCESKMAELNNLLTSILNPRSFMCETLGIADSRVEDLDVILANTFKKNFLKSGFNVMDFSQNTEKQRGEEMPTLLHFAAHYGLKELCAAILDSPGAGSACRVRNLRGHNPADIAEKEGHLCLANMLDNYSRLSETAEIYIYMKGMTEDDPSVYYENIRTAFQNDIENTISCSEDHRSSESNSKVRISASAENLSESDKMAAATRMCTSQPNLLKRAGEMAEVSPASTASIARDVERFLHSNEQEDSSKCSNIKMYPESQQELIQLLEDFKQEKYSIGEVELLFHNWKLRRENAGSFYEKQEQLKMMQQKYELIQRKCQENTKKKSAVERFRSFLNLNIKKEQSSAVSSKANAVTVREKGKESTGNALSIDAISCRPPSTWSNGSNSSSSSDRCSTVSALSVSSMTSDSGALSDIGEEQQNEKQVRKLVRRSCNLPKQQLLPSPVIVNPEYMLSAGFNQASPKAIPPKPPLKPPKVAMKPTLSPDAIKNRKPAPSPRNLFSPDDDDGGVLKVQGSMLPESNNSVTSPPYGLRIASPTVSPTDGYMRMDSPPLSAFCRSPKNTTATMMEHLTAPSESSGRGKCGYIDMGFSSIVSNPSAYVDIAGTESCVRRQNLEYFQHYSRGNSPDPDWCDSVPDMLAPPPPIAELPKPDRRPPLPPPRKLSSSSTPKFK